MMRQQHRAIFRFRFFLLTICIQCVGFGCELPDDRQETEASGTDVSTPVDGFIQDMQLDTSVRNDAMTDQMILDTGAESDQAMPPENRDCSVIANTEDWTLCGATPDGCAAVFYDGAGCYEVCAAVGLGCAEVWENLDDQCGADTDRPALGCAVRTGHDSDYCVCRGPVGEPPAVVSSTAAYEDIFEELVGFGSDTTGGQGGSICRVTNTDNAGSGSLRNCVENTNGSTWVRFEVDGQIRLSSNIVLPSDITIDGRGHDIRIQRRGLSLRNQENVILTNLTFEDGADGEDQDAVQIRGGHKIWVHHCSFSNYADGLLDLTKGTRDVTVSWNVFSDHDKVLLISANDNDTEDQNTRVTLHHNWFKETRQRHPRVRHAKVHAYNNYFDKWYSYGMGCSTNAQCYSEKNVFEAGRRNDAILTQVGEDRGYGSVESHEDLLLNGAVVEERGSVFSPEDFYSYLADDTDGLSTLIEANAGAR